VLIAGRAPHPIQKDRIQQPLCMPYSEEHRKAVCGRTARTV
jgi:hypothetical protein